MFESRCRPRGAPGYGRGVCALVATLLLSACGESAAPPEKEVVRPIKAVKVADASQFERRRFPGQAKATQELELSFRVAGPLIQRPVDVGSEVEPGDLVARIDPTDFQLRVRNVEGQLAESQAALKRAEADFGRSRNIMKEDPGAISQTAVDRARENRDRAAASVSSLQASVDDARNQLSYASLTAPFAGIVVATYIENYEDVRAKQPVVRILDDSRIEMIINIPENLISYVRFVTNLEVEFDTFPGRSVPARIKEIGTEASTTTRTYPVTLIMDQLEDLKILPGMAGNATGTPPADAVGAGAGITVPVTAVFSPEDSQQTYVWVIDEATGVVARREVGTGSLSSDGVEVTEGLEPGEWIATAGVNYVKEGQKVRILDDDRT